jgi:hypothetical protein
MDKIPNTLWKEESSHKMILRMSSREIDTGLGQGSLNENMA